jgi:hypothetical protein
MQDKVMVIVNKSFENMAKLKYFETKIAFMKKLRAYYIWRMLATILFRVSSSCHVSKNLEIKIHKTIILPVVLYGCETWSLTLREEHRLGMSVNRVLRRIFGPNREVLVGC